MRSTPNYNSIAPSSVLLENCVTSNELRHARVQTGDLWQLGTHRLLCGDCTRAEDIERLMQGEQADMLFTDPPYGVGYKSRRLRPVKLRDPLYHDDLGIEATRLLVSQSLRRAPLRAGGAFYVCSAGGENETLFRLALEAAGLPLKQSLIWVKQAFVLLRQEYHWRHEALLYGWKPGASHYFVADRTQDTVWEIARPTRSVLHPTMKPVALVKRAIENSSRPGEVVYDGFGGLGTTLMACEETGRKYRMLEIEPHYCAVIVQRWEEASGGKASRLSKNP